MLQMTITKETIHNTNQRVIENSMWDWFMRVLDVETFVNNMDMSLLSHLITTHHPECYVTSTHHLQHKFINFK